MFKYFVLVVCHSLAQFLPNNHSTCVCLRAQGSKAGKTSSSLVESRKNVAGNYDHVPLAQSRALSRTLAHTHLLAHSTLLSHTYAHSHLLLHSRALSLLHSRALSSSLPFLSFSFVICSRGFSVLVHDFLVPYLMVVARVHCGKKPGHIETSKIHVPMSEGVSEVGEQVNE